ncbi:MAG: hypothetical protein KGI45_00090 [Patescibacteria group bacterium]|nr:hypothetical protein [Patescibacteria group bacterium]MDE1966462.1 hypothetical protein [Patescibacteria group bacterium]
MEINKIVSLECIGGGRASGKSTITKLVSIISDPEQITSFDCSTAIEWCRLNLRSQRPVLVKMIEQQKSECKNGGLYTPIVAVHSVIYYMKALPQSEVVIVPGFPRSDAQITLWESAQPPCSRPKINYTEFVTTWDEMVAGVRVRQKATGEIRDDEQPEALRRAWTINEKARNAILARLKESRCGILSLRRGTTYEEIAGNLRLFISHMKIERALKMDLLARTGSTQIDDAIKEILRPRAVRAQSVPSPTPSNMAVWPSTQASVASVSAQAQA